MKRKKKVTSEEEEEKERVRYSFIDLDTSIRFPSNLVLMFGGTSFLAGAHLRRFPSTYLRLWVNRYDLLSNFYSINPHNLVSQLLASQFLKSLLKRHILPQTKIKHIIHTHRNAC